MAECANCHGERVVDGKCLDCGAVKKETAEKPQHHETAAKARPARKSTPHKR